jgi:thiamine-monophosphate kinase
LTTPGNTEPRLVTELGERGLIERIRQLVPPPGSRLPIGIGDDAAVAVPQRGALQVLTTDALVEGIHFERRLSSLSDIGYKALAVNVSDVAAMGGTSQVALLSLMLPSSTSVQDVDELLGGFLELAGETDVHLGGGNITASPGPLVIDVTVCGYVKPRKLLTRRAGRPGDGLFVTGTIGAARAGLESLKAGFTSRSEVSPGGESRPADLAGCVARYRRPAPRARFGAILGRTRAATACMDLSDGLADAITQVAEASGTGAVIDARLLPIDRSARDWFAWSGNDPVLAAVAGGEDYELLFASSPRAAGRLKAAVRLARGLKVTRIGELTRDRMIVLQRDGRSEPLPHGFVHF